MKTHRNPRLFLPPAGRGREKHPCDIGDNRREPPGHGHVWR
nr:MAG TPA: hypothetical protein [Caudoviricetes sp.]